MNTLTRLGTTMFAAITIVAAATTANADILDQDNRIPIGIGGGAVAEGFVLAQTVTVGLDGQLSRIGLQVNVASDAIENLNIRLLGLNAGAPDTSNVLATAALVPSDVPVGNASGTIPVTFVDFAADNLVFSVGDTFAIELSSDAANNSPFNERYLWSRGTAYSGGVPFRNGSEQNGNDYNFQTFVVPEPSSLALLGFGGLFVARRRR